ncbi:acyltransferase [Enorma phocaeensis]|uniref:acyltransferase n=1 Tax=Enorma phocaeensis TaxID=1871019 RepID=UPI0023575582|nr:acyltransferase [Enorma phocaeensis]
MNRSRLEGQRKGTDSTGGLAEKGERVPLYDIICNFAILCVVLCHSSEVAYLPLVSIPYAVLHFIGRLGVPLFFFLTGALVLSKRFDSPEGIRRFYTHNLIGLLVTAEIWIAIYCVWMSLQDGTVTIKNYIEYTLFLEAIPLTHWWYIPTILSIYVVIPLLASGIRALSMRGSLMPVIGFNLLFSFAVPTINRFSPLFGLPTINSQLTSVLFGPYITYIVVGYLVLHEKALSRIKSAVLLTVAILCSACAVIEGLLTAGLWYDSLFLLGSSTALVELTQRASACKLPTRLQSLMKLLSTCSFGVYLVHVPILDLISEIIVGISNFERTMTLFLSVSLLSFGFTVLIKLATKRFAWLQRALLNS